MCSKLRTGHWRLKSDSPSPALPVTDLGGDTLAAVLTDAVARLKANGTWKRWRWILSEGVRYIHLQTKPTNRDAETASLTETLTWLASHHTADEPELPSAEAFRAHVRAKLAADLGGVDLAALPLREGYTPPSQEEKDMRARCAALLERGRNATAAFNDDLARGRDSAHGGVTRRLGADAALEATSRHHCEQVASVLEELRGEDAALYDAVASPIAAALASLSPQLAKRFGPGSGGPPGGLIDIDLSDLEANLNSTDAAAMYDFCIDKLTEFAAERTDPAACASGEAIEDVDLFALTPYEGEALDCSEPSMFVNAKWLRHLEQRQMGDSGRICRVTAAGLEPEEAASSSSSSSSDGGAPKTQAPCVDCPQGGLVLDWVFGKIVNTAEKARSGAQTSLAGSPMAGMPGKPLRPEELRSAAESAYNALKRGCLDHTALAEQRAQAKVLLADALRARLAAEQAGVPALVAEAIASAAAGGGAPRQGATATSPATIAVALAQEDVLCAVKIMLMSSEAAGHAAAVRAAHAKVTRGHPEYRRLQAELEELDAKTAAAHANSASGGGDDHPGGSGAVTAAERAQLMTQLAQRSSSLNALVESRDASRAAGEIAQREVHRLETWRHTLKALGVDACGEDAAASAAAVTRFDADVLRQLYTQDMGRQLFDQLKARVKDWDKKAERCSATLCHSEARLVNLCAVDPGAPIGQHLVLPALQDRIFKAAELRAAAKALEAEAAVAEEGAKERAAKEAAEAAARRKREAAAAKAAAARAKKLASNGVAPVQGGSGASALHDRASSPDDVQQRQDAQAKAHAEKLAARRAAEDAALEARRLELMAEGGHWKERADAVAAEAALLKAASEDGWKPAKAKAADDHVQEVVPPPKARTHGQAGGKKQGGGGGAVTVSASETAAAAPVIAEKVVEDSGSSVMQASPPPPAAPAASGESAAPAPAAVAPAVPPPAKVMVTSPLPASAISAPPFQAPSMASTGGVVFQGAAAVAMARAEVVTALQAARAAMSSLAAMPPALRELAAPDIGAAVNSLAKASAALALAQV